MLFLGSIQKVLLLFLGSFNLNDRKTTHVLGSHKLNKKKKKKLILLVIILTTLFNVVGL